MARKPSRFVAVPDNDLAKPASAKSYLELTRDAAVSVELILQQAVLNNAVQENVRRYRAIASLCRQTAAFRPGQKMTLLQQAEEWERLAIRELESHCDPVEAVNEIDEVDEEDPAPQEPLVDTRWWLPRREGLFAGLQA